jgi:hypothetical protein
MDAKVLDPAVKNMTIDDFRNFIEAQEAAEQPKETATDEERFGGASPPEPDDDLRGGGISQEQLDDLLNEEAAEGSVDDYEDTPRRAISPSLLDEYRREQEALAEAEDVPRAAPSVSPAASSPPPSQPPPAPPLSPAQPIPAPSISPPTTPGAVSPPTPLTAVQFSAYFPREIMPNTWQPLRAYVYKPGAQSAVTADAAQELGSLLSGYREVARPAHTSIAEGALITATPELAGFQFNPPSAQIAFYDDWQRFDFRLRAVTAALDHASNGRITFTVEGIIVADVPLAIYVGATSAAGAPAPSPVSAMRPMYQSIFCSYSHKDTQIVERIEKAYKVLGFTSLRDVLSLRSGQDWDAELLRLIDQADIFQLFWSNAAAESKAVRKEWMYALQRRAIRPDFVRPVYWQQPMPPLPPELSPIHFAYEPTLDDE